MKISIDKKIFERYSNIRLYFILVENIDNKNKLKESKHMLKEIEEWVRLSFHKENIKNHALILPWAIVQQEFGNKAKHYQTSVELLINSVLKNKSYVSNNVLTNLLYYLALKHIVPFGIDDFEKIKGNINFMLSEKEIENYDIKKGEIYYTDNKDILGTKLDFWKNKRTSLTPNTKKALIHFDILPPLDKDKLKALMEDVKTLIPNFCNTKVKLIILSKNKNSITIS